MRAVGVMKSEFNPELNFVFKHGNDKHDTETKQDPSILQDKESIMTEACFTGIVMQHLRNLYTDTNTYLGQLLYNGEKKY